MNARFFPLRGLRVIGERIELRFPTDDDVERLAEIVAGEPYAAGVGWLVDSEGPEDRGRRYLQNNWRTWGLLQPRDWDIELVGVVDGELVGTQGMRAKGFPAVREATTGSWVRAARRGAGIGTLMRAAILHLAFEGLGARYMTTGATADNAASHGVTRRLGYTEDGLERFQGNGDEVIQLQRYRLDADTWRARPGRPHFRIEGLEACLPFLGLATPPSG